MGDPCLADDKLKPNFPISFCCLVILAIAVARFGTRFCKRKRMKNDDSLCLRHLQARQLDVRIPLALRATQLVCRYKLTEC